MSFDMSNNISGWQPGQLPRRPLAQSASGNDNLLMNIAQGTQGGAADSSKSKHRSGLQQWGHSAFMWGSREAIANAVDRIITPNSAAGKSVDNVLKKLNAGSSKAPAPEIKAPLSTYSNLLHLGRDQVSVNKLSTSSFTEAVKSNVQPFKEAIKPKNIGNFFEGVTVKSYVRDTVIDRNIRPIKDLMNNSPDKHLGRGVAQSLALGLVGYDVLKHTTDAYQHAKAKEDGSFKSKLNTYKEATVAFGKYAIRDVASWEAAGAGAAVGRALIPLAIGGVSLGGIAVGAAVGLGAQKAFNQVLKTGDHDPAQQAKEHKSE